MYGEIGLITDEDGHPLMYVPPGLIEGKNLIGIKDHIDALNNPEFPNAIINPQGAVTDPDACVCIRTGLGIYGVIIGHEFNPFVYRGENKIHKKFTPSILRYKGYGDEKFCVAKIKQWEFKEFFKNLPYYSRCEKFEVLGNQYRFDMQAISQHYGFISRYIDMSKDRKVAEFFAYTYKKDGKYWPIINFKNYRPILYRGNLRKLYYSTGGALKFIGFQGLARPFNQKAMAIDASAVTNVKLLFKKEELPKNSKIAMEIFDYYEGGKALFPEDYFGEITSKIQENKCLSRGFFNKYCAKYGTEADTLEKKINAAGYVLTDTDGIPEYDADKLDKELDKNLRLFYKKVMYRLGTPSGDTRNLPKVIRRDKPANPGD